MGVCERGCVCGGDDGSMTAYVWLLLAESRRVSVLKDSEGCGGMCVSAVQTEAKTFSC